MHPVLLAVDGTGLLVRCSRAARGRPLMTSGGVPTASLLMYINSLARKVRLHNPDYLAIGWDGPQARSWRQALYPGYKAGRPEHPPGRELERAVAFGNAAGIRQLLVDEFEADDVLAALHRTYRREHPDGRMVVCSDDADLLQLADSNTDIAYFSCDDPVTATDIESAWDVPPRYISRVRALAGDRSDGIPGIRGVGPSRAARMVAAADFAWPLPSRRPAAELEAAEIYRKIIDLVDPWQRPEHVTGMDYFAVRTHARWDPPVNGAIQEFLLNLEMTSLLERLQAGRLW